MKLALRVEADSYRATREGVPRIADLLERRGAGATFLFGLGPDHTGVLRGRILPARDIGKGCAGVLRGVRDRGFEPGIHAWDAAKWRHGIAAADGRWTGWQMSMAASRFREIFGTEPGIHGAPGWRMNVHAFRRTQALGLRFASDTRGTHPFIPVVRAEIVACPQFPTTLPTLEEAGAVEHLLERTAAEPRDHVFTLHAGARLAPGLERLLDGWQAQGYEVVALGALAAGTELASLPLHSVVEAPAAGAQGACATQGAAFLESADSP